MTEAGQDRACIVGTGAVAFLVYLCTACPTVPPGDSGELIAAAWSGGVPHPPGYPLYAVLGWLWSHVLWPFGNVAWRLNIFSAAAMAGAVGFGVAGARQAGAGRWSAVAAAATFALAAEPWRAAVAAEVFAGHACLTAATLWLLLRWGNAPADAPSRTPWVAALVFGLSGAHHQTSLFLAPAIWMWVFAHRTRLGEQALKKAAWCVGIAGAAALLPYLVLMPMSARDDALVWGDLTTLGDDTGYWNGSKLPESAQGAGLPKAITEMEYGGLGEGLHHHVRRGAYGPLLGSRAGHAGPNESPTDRLTHVGRWMWQYGVSGAGGLWLLLWLLAPFAGWCAVKGRDATAAAAKVAVPGLLAAFLLTALGGGTGFVAAATGLAVWFGVWGGLHESPGARRTWFLVLAWFVAGPLFIAYGVNFDAGDPLRQAVVARFFVMPAVPLTLLGALGLHALSDWKGAGVARAAGVACAALALTASLVTGASLAGVTAVEQFGRDLLRSIPETPAQPGAKPALLFVQGDVSNNAIDYLQYCEGARPDVAMLNLQKLNYPWSVRREERRFGGDPATAIDIPGERYDGRVVTSLGMVRGNIARRRIYVFGMSNADVSYQQEFVRVPHGLVSTMVPRADPAHADFAAIERTNLELLNAIDWPAVAAMRGDAYFLDEIRHSYTRAWVELALFFHTGPSGSKNPIDAPRAESTYRRALELFPDHPTLNLNFALLLLQVLQRADDARPYFARFLQLRPNDERASAIAQMAGLPVTPAPK